MENSTKNLSLSQRDMVRIVIIDLLLYVSVYFIPIISHITSFPLYLVEPMRLMLFALIFITPHSNNNHYWIAFTLPLVSFVFSGHPLFLKSIIMSLELVINVAVLHALINKTPMFLAVLISVLVSKVAYYMVKLVLIFFGVLNMEIISTRIGWQIGVALLLALIGELINKKQKGAENYD